MRIFTSHSDKPGNASTSATRTASATRNGEKRTITIVGVDETDTAKGRVSWISPVAKALIKAREGDTVFLKTPAGPEELELLEVRYDPID